jgi:hypothetical protein
MADDPTPLGDTEYHRLARSRFKLADDTDTKQRERERNDIAFYDGEQWPADIKLLREGQQPTNGMPAVPARPTLVINNVREPVRQILNEERASDLAIEIVAADDFGDLNVTPDPTEIDLREGLVRRIQRQSSAADARTWAYSRAVIAGRGYYIVRTKFLPGKTFDQEVYIDKLYNQAAVLLDPSHEDVTGADCEWGFWGQDFLWPVYRAKYPKAADGSANALFALRVGDHDDAWRALNDPYPEWFNDIDDTKTNKNKVRAVRVMNYIYCETTTRELAILADGSLVWANEMPKGQTAADTRTVETREWHWDVIDGVQILEQNILPGPDFPIVKVLGEELHPYDHERRAEGMVRPAIDAQRGSNYMISKLVETVGLTPIPALQVDPDAIEGYEEWYKVAATRALPFLPSRTFDDYGRQLAPPHRPAVDPNLAPLSQSIALFSQFVEKTTAVPAARVGDIDPVTRSGKAIQQLTANSQQSTSNFLDNLVRSIRREGEIINNLLYPIYGGRPGRLVRLMTGENQQRLALITDGKSSGAPPDMALMQKAQMVAKLTPDAQFNIAIKVTRNFDTRRQELETTLGEIIAKDPQYGMSVFGDLFFKYSDAPGHMEMAGRARAMLAPQVQQMLMAQEQGTAPPTPRELHLQQQLQQAQQQLQQLSLDQHGKVIETQGRMQIEQVKQTHEDQRAALDRETKIAVAEIAAQAKNAIESLRVFMEERARVGAQIHDAGQSQLTRDADAVSQASAQAHELDLQSQQQQAAAAAAGQQQGHEAAMGVMDQTAPQPPAAEESADAE